MSSEQRWTVAALLAWTVDRFESAGLDSPRVDAEHLLAHALGCTRMDLYVNHDQPVGASERQAFRGLIKRRLAREPVAYIEGVKGFHALDLELRVDRRVLIPRPETELLVDWVLEEFPPQPVPSIAIVDVGTGSGAIALAIKKARPDATVVAVDDSPDAVEMARENAAALNIEIEVLRSDLLAEASAPTQGWHAVVANLPYIPTAVLETLQPEVREFEPRQALDGGEDGLDLVRRLATDALAALAPHFGLYLEVGYDQAEATAAILRAAGFVDVEVRQDHAGIPRMVRGVRPDPPE